MSPATLRSASILPLHPDAESIETGHAAAWIAEAGIACECALEVLMDVLPESALKVESASRDMSRKFTALADSARTQGDMMRALTENIGSIQVEDTQVTLNEFIALFSRTLDDAVTKMLFVAKKALSMVYSMDDAIKNLHEIGRFSKKIQSITKQAGLLALNAQIEAVRAGDAGRGFCVVANEMKTLSSEIATLSEQMRQRTDVIMQSVVDGFSVLKEVATTDMNANIQAKERLDALMQGLVRQNTRTRTVMENSAESSRAISETISGMIVNLQFQDRNSQIIENAVLMLQHCFQNIESWRRNAAPIADAHHHILACIKLGEIRQRYHARLQQRGLESNDSHAAAPPTNDDDIELF